MKSSPYDSPECAVRNYVIFVPLSDDIPLERGHQRRAPPALENVILPLLVHLTVEDQNRGF